jgi:hypothetical protein
MWWCHLTKRKGIKIIEIYSVTDVFVASVLQISFKDYYKKQYAIDIKDFGQPLLLSRLKVKIRGRDVRMNLTRVSCLMGYQWTGKKKPSNEGKILQGKCKT